MIQTLNLRITSACQQAVYFFTIFLLPLLVAVFKPMIIGSWVNGSTTELPQLATKLELFHCFLSPNAGGKIQTLDLRIIS
jgi:hypothetical protein